MRYPEQLIIPMRQDLTRHGIQETRTAEEVDQLLGPNSGTVMMVTRPPLVRALRDSAPGDRSTMGPALPAVCEGRSSRRLRHPRRSL